MWAVELWACTKDWHAAVSKREHVQQRADARSGMLVQACTVQQLQPVQCSCQAGTRERLSSAPAGSPANTLARGCTPKGWWTCDCSTFCKKARCCWDSMFSCISSRGSVASPGWCRGP